MTERPILSRRPPSRKNQKRTDGLSCKKAKGKDAKRGLLLSRGALEQTASVLFARQESAALDGEIEACDRPSLGAGVPCAGPAQALLRPLAATGRRSMAANGGAAQGAVAGNLGPPTPWRRSGCARRVYGVHVEGDDDAQTVHC